jgi:hypothetical protein
LREALAALGPWFVVQQPGAGWQPLSALLTAPEPLAERVDAVKAALGGDLVPVRVAASVAQLGLVARLVAPAFGAAVLEGRVPALDQASWQPGIGGPMPLALSDEALSGVAAGDPAPISIGELAPISIGELAGAFTDRVLEGPVRDLVELTAALSVSRQVLWGNVASGLNGAASMMTKSRPDLEATVRLLATDILNRPPLRGTATGTGVAGMVAGAFRRRSCCLLYRIAPPGPKSLCGDCVITRG